MKSHNAFSLLEMLVVLCISAILMAGALPHWHAFFMHEDERRWQAQLVETIAYARAEARARHEAIIFCHSADGHTCAGNWSDGWIVLDDQQHVLRYVQLSRATVQLQWRSYPYYRDYLLFEPGGAMGSVEGVFSYCRKGEERAAWVIVFNRAGRTRVLSDAERVKYKCA